MIASIPVHVARGLLRMAGEDPTRPYISGFWLEPSGVAVATDGTAMMVVRGVHTHFRGPPVFVASCDLAPFLKGRKPAETLVLSRGSMSIGADTRAASFREAHGFPGATGDTITHVEWRRVIPQEVTGTYRHEGKSGAIHFTLDSRITERARMAVADVRNVTPAKQHGLEFMPNGNSHAVALPTDDILVICMPMRCCGSFDPESTTKGAKEFAAMRNDNPTGEPVNGEALNA